MSLDPSMTWLNIGALVERGQVLTFACPTTTLSDPSRQGARPDPSRSMNLERRWYDSGWSNGAWALADDEATHVVGHHNVVLLFVGGLGLVGATAASGHGRDN